MKLTRSEKIALYMGGGVLGFGFLSWLLSKPVAPPPSASAQPEDTTGPPTLLGNPAPLIQGRHYFAKVGLSWLECQLVSQSAAANYATKMGFANVEVYMASASLPNWWPADGRSDDSSSHCTIWVEGDWAGQDEQYNFPSQLKQAWLSGPMPAPQVA